MLGESKSRAARVHAVHGGVPAADVTDPVPAADCVLPGASKLRAARGQAVYAHATPTVDCAMPGASKSRAARGHEDRLKVNAVAAAIASVPAADCALPGAYKSRAARGRDAIANSVSAADCALPGEMKSRRGRTPQVPVADCALPGERKCSSTRGRKNVPDVPDAPDAPDVPDAPVAADVSQIPGTELSGSHKLCATHPRKVSVDTGNTSAQLSTKGINMPLTDREHKCAYCASMGRCKKHCFTKRRRLSKVATTKSSGGSREPMDA